MTREDIIKLAREAGLYDCIVFGRIESKDTVIERFAALVAAEIGIETHRRGYESGLRDGAIAEREACARLVDYWEARQGEHADAIRARGQA